MSNIIAGDVFLKVIEEVVSASQNDFEENGVQQQTLVELQQSWQHKLSQMDIAQMPWDPKPAPPPQQAAPQPVQQQNQNGSQMQHAHPQNNGQPMNNGQPRIKNEPGSETNFQNIPQANYPQQGTNPMLAQQRAASLLQAQFGRQADASIGNMQQRGIALPGQQQQRPQGLQLPGQGPPNPQQQYAQRMREQQAGQQPHVKVEGNGQYQQQPQQQSNLGYAQTDGAGDGLDEWNAYMTQRRMVSAADVEQNDRLMRNDIAELARSLDNGLMLPLQRSAGKKRRITARNAPLSQVAEASSGIPQLDGEDEKEDIKDEEDEDAINSDLDSSEDEGAQGEEDDDDIDSMLCTYDKVQRVKNKWKCTLKDGIFRANGKEYLFHKAQGDMIEDIGCIKRARKAAARAAKLQAENERKHSERAQTEQASFEAISSPEAAFKPEDSPSIDFMVRSEGNSPFDLEIKVESTN